MGKNMIYPGAPRNSCPCRRIRSKLQNSVVYLMLALFLFIVSPLEASAEDFPGRDGWSVQFDGNKMSSTFKDAEMDDVVNVLQPGDTVEIHLSLSNTSDGATDWYMSNEVLLSLEESQDAAGGGAYSYILSYMNPEGDITLLYSSENVGGEDTKGGEGLHQATDSLEEFFYLDRIDGGASGEITLKVGLEGETQGNDYQNTLAQLQMNFAVEPVANPSGEPPKKPGSNSVTLPKTGDDTKPMLFAGLALAAGLVCVVLVILRIKKKDAAPEEGKGTAAGRNGQAGKRGEKNSTAGGRRRR